MSKHLKIMKTEILNEYILLFPVSEGASFRYADLQMEANTVRQLAAKHRELCLIIDLGNLNYFGSEFIGSLVTVAREKKNQGRKVVICNAVPQMKDVLENMGLFKLWPYKETREEAVAFITEKTLQTT